MDNALLHASRHPPSDKIEEQITFSLRHASLYLAESDDEQDEKSAAANTFYICCGGGGFRSSLSAITVYVSVTPYVFRWSIFTPYLFVSNNPLTSDDMVD